MYSRNCGLLRQIEYDDYNIQTGVQPLLMIMTVYCDCF